VKRWLVLILGLVIAAGAVVLLASEVGEDAPPRGEINDSSRTRLERVLREADREAGQR
jgi:hypothetical protein